jgi:glycosyltransferase involved in cell wall biosynthesis
MKLLYITNIPAPYRQKRYNVMADIFPRYGIDFEVLYMARNEPDREWIIPADSYNYPHKFFRGIHPVIGGFFAHFNPGLLFRLLKNDYNIAIVGGMASPTHWLAPLFIGRKKIQIMSVESNLYSVNRKSGIGAKIKHFLLSKANAYQITGNPQKEYIKFFYPKAEGKTFIRLPNLIDENVFGIKVRDLRVNAYELRKSFNINESTQMWVLPARLIELKGIIPFLNLMTGIENAILFILGDGELRVQIESLIKKKNLPVKIIGFVQQDEIVRYYAVADLFILPSLKDSSPLSPIEACAAELPVLVSSRIGNIEDVVEYDVNGWFYDPIDEEKKGRRLLEKISGMTRLELKTYASNSRNRYYERFSTEKCIEDYAIQINRILSK